MCHANCGEHSKAITFPRRNDKLPIISAPAYLRGKLERSGTFCGKKKKNRLEICHLSCRSSESAPTVPSPQHFAAVGGSAGAGRVRGGGWIMEVGFHAQPS